MPLESPGNLGPQWLAQGLLCIDGFPWINGAARAVGAVFALRPTARAFLELAPSHVNAWTTSQLRPYQCVF